MLLFYFLTWIQWASQAQADTCPAGIPDPNNTNCRQVTQFGFRGTTGDPNELNTILAKYWDTASKIVFGLMTAVAVLVLIWAGVQYITSGGSPEKAKKARATIINAILGIVILVTAYGILSLILGLVGTTAQVVAPTPTP